MGAILNFTFYILKASKSKGRKPSMALFHFVHFAPPHDYGLLTPGVGIMKNK